MKTEAKETVRTISDFINNYNMRPQEFIDEMGREHRTLQQNFTRLVFMWIEHCATDEYQYDLRNEMTHRISKETIQAFAETKKFQIPDHWKETKPSHFLPII